MLRIFDENNSFTFEKYTVSGTFGEDFKKYSAVSGRLYFEKETTPAIMIVELYKIATAQIVVVKSMTDINIDYDTHSYTAKLVSSSSKENSLSLAFHITTPPVRTKIENFTIAEIPMQIVSLGEEFEPIHLNDYVQNENLLWSCIADNLEVSIDKNNIATITQKDLYYGTETVKFTAVSKNGVSNTIDVKFVIQEFSPPMPDVWLKMNEVDGVVAQDSSGNGYNGVNSNISTNNTIEDRVGYYFDNSFVTVENFSASGEISISMWIRLQETGQKQMLIQKEKVFALRVDAQGKICWFDDSKWDHAFFGYQDVGIVFDRWHFLTITKDSELKVYLDGELKYSKQFPDSIADGKSYPVLIGKYYFPALPLFFRGYMSDLKIHKKVLSSGEIKTYLSSSMPILDTTICTKLYSIAPFSTTTNIVFDLAEESKVSLNIYTQSGQLVKNIFNGKLVQGTHNYEWDAKDRAGIIVSNGSYICRLTTSAGYSQDITLTKQ
ncbi:MAG: hypothetical protein CR982_03475 [Candidatus Cloacimonadota bacterium]|nr:MAG: hypothetical protein CR982_03475 [Candidatus Cloacimonadota bacterium]